MSKRSTTNSSSFSAICKLLHCFRVISRKKNTSLSSLNCSKKLVPENCLPLFCFSSQRNAQEEVLEHLKVFYFNLLKNISPSTNRNQRLMSIKVMLFVKLFCCLKEIYLKKSWLYAKNLCLSLKISYYFPTKFYKTNFKHKLPSI